MTAPRWEAVIALRILDHSPPTKLEKNLGDEDLAPIPHFGVLFKMARQASMWICASDVLPNVNTRLSL